MANGEVRAQDYTRLQTAREPGPAPAARCGHQPRPGPPVVQPVAGGAHHPGTQAAGATGRSGRRSRTASIGRPIADGVYLGAAVPIFGPITPGNRHVVRGRYSDSACTTPPGRGRCSTGLGCSKDRDGDGLRDTADERRSAFPCSRQTGHVRGRTAEALQAQLKELGIAVDLVTLDQRGSSGASARATTTASISPPRRAAPTRP